jgi:hypothetical protein
MELHFFLPLANFIRPGAVRGHAKSRDCGTVCRVAQLRTSGQVASLGVRVRVAVRG